MVESQRSPVEPLREAEASVRALLAHVQGPSFLPAIERRLYVNPNPAHEDWESWEQIEEKLRDLALAFERRADEVREAIKAVRPSG